MDVRWLTAALSAATFIAVAGVLLYVSVEPRAPSLDNPPLRATAESLPPPNVGAEITNGRAVVVGAVAEISPDQACMRCHGVDGVGDGSGAFPRLDGQAEWYLYKQLTDYASGMRSNDVMTPIAQSMTDAQMRAVAAWYASQETMEAFSRQSDPLTLQIGGAIAAIGVPDREIIACADCHGARGEGAFPTVPYLAGQYAPYTQLQLELWNTGVRANDPADVMRAIAVAMSNAEMAAVAQYYESVPPNSGERASGMQ